MFIGYLIDEDENGEEVGRVFGAGEAFEDALAITFRHITEFYGGNLMHVGDIQILEKPLSNEDADKLNQTIESWLSNCAKREAEEQQ